MSHPYNIDPRDLAQGSASRHEAATPPPAANHPPATGAASFDHRRHNFGGGQNSVQRVRADLTAALSQYKQAEQVEHQRMGYGASGTASHAIRRSSQSRPQSSSGPHRINPWTMTTDEVDGGLSNAQRTSSAHGLNNSNANYYGDEGAERETGPYLILNRFPDVRTSPSRAHHNPPPSQHHHRSGADGGAASDQEHQHHSTQNAAASSPQQQPSSSFVPHVPALQLQISLMMDRQREILHQSLSQMQTKVDASVSKLDHRMKGIEETCAGLSDALLAEANRARRERDSLAEQLGQVSEERDRYLRKVLQPQGAATGATANGSGQQQLRRPLSPSAGQPGATTGASSPSRYSAAAATVGGAGGGGASSSSAAAAAAPGGARPPLQFSNVTPPAPSAFGTNGQTTQQQQQQTLQYAHSSGGVSGGPRSLGISHTTSPQKAETVMSRLSGLSSGAAAASAGPGEHQQMPPPPMRPSTLAPTDAFQQSSTAVGATATASPLLSTYHPAHPSMTNTGPGVIGAVA